tara:strand:- start:50121 stop:50819 length:699 start_codon:yes stop_codon:yes gene_type:complete
LIKLKKYSIVYKLFYYIWSFSMKNLTRVAFYTLVLVLVPLSYTFAANDDDGVISMGEADDEVLSVEDAQALIDERSTAKDALGGTVPGPSKEYYDIYSRQLSFREKSKVYRSSIDSRRVEFEEPRTKIIHIYKDIQSKVFSAETAAYQASLSDDKSPEDSVVVDEDVVSAMKETIEVPDVVDSPEAMPEEEHTLKEIDVPEHVTDEGDEQELEVKKKVVTSDDAPAFDPENL